MGRASSRSGRLFDVVELDPPHGAPPPRRLRVSGQARSIALALWAGAAAVALSAPFTTLASSREIFRPDGTLSTDVFGARSDGWARTSGPRSGGTADLGQDARYGVAAGVAAVLLLAALALLVASRTRRAIRQATALATVSTLTLTIATAVQWHHVESALAGLRVPWLGRTVTLQADVGPCLWLGATAALLAAFGIVTSLASGLATVRLTADAGRPRRGTRCADRSGP